MMRALVIFVVLSTSFAAAAAKGNATKPTKPTQNRSHSFDSQVVEGEVYRPDYSVVTGDAPGEGWGVLRLRANFDDHILTDQEEKKR